MNNLIVFTGGPGSGKTTVIESLNDSGFQCADEVGRKVIQYQIRYDGKALPWKDKVAFRDEMVREEINAYNHYKESKQLVFFDRGIVDSYGYSMLEKLAVSDDLLNYCKILRYHPKVFIFPPWETIFTNDTERKQDFDEAIATYNEMVSAYKQFGYSLCEVPKTSIAERKKFVLSLIHHC